MIQPGIPADYAKSNNSFHNFISIADLIFKHDDRYKVNPKELLIDAVHENREIGSSTCVLATLDEIMPLLYTANLGDSGYMLLRKEGLDLI